MLFVTAPLSQRALRELGVAADDTEHVVEVVRDAGGECAEGFELLRFADLRLEPRLLGLGLTRHGEIADHEMCEHASVQRHVGHRALHRDVGLAAMHREFVRQRGPYVGAGGKRQKVVQQSMLQRLGGRHAE